MTREGGRASDPRLDRPRRRLARCDAPTPRRRADDARERSAFFRSRSHRTVNNNFLSVSACEGPLANQRVLRG
eukprot:31032-Pelagococcus_subviridis.AAC.30